MPTTMAATVRSCFCALRVKPKPFVFLLLVVLFDLLVLALLVVLLLVGFLLALLVRAIGTSSVLMNWRNFIYGMELGLIFFGILSS
jgi:hypothetical protein